TAPPPEALVDVLDRLLDTGVVLDGQVTISLAGVDLIHVGLRALLASVDTATRMVLLPEKGA
ncbi:gas vesicle protein, partial [Paracraurococcus ruber]